MDDKEILRLMRYIDKGSVISYREKDAVYTTYLVVEEIKDGRVCGQMAAPIGVNSISLEELVKKEGLSIVSPEDFKKFQKTPQ